MPELLRSRAPFAACGAPRWERRFERVELFHRSLRRRLTAAHLRSLRGARVRAVERRGKHQLFVLEDGRVLHAHFRMTGDWTIDAAADALPRFARAAITFTDDSRVVLDDPRALSTLDLHPAHAPPDLGLGLEPSDPALTPAVLCAICSRAGADRSSPCSSTSASSPASATSTRRKSLWHAKISPSARASSLDAAQVTALLAAIRRVIARATGARYTDSSVSRLAVYDREGKPCRRCRTPIKRIAQAGRSTYYCPKCQR